MKKWIDNVQEDGASRKYLCIILKNLHRTDPDARALFVLLERRDYITVIRALSTVKQVTAILQAEIGFPKDSLSG